MEKKSILIEASIFSVSSDVMCVIRIKKYPIYLMVAELESIGNADIQDTMCAL